MHLRGDMWILQRPTTVRSAYIRESRSDIQQDGLPGPDIYLMRGDNKVSQPAQDQPYAISTQISLLRKVNRRKYVKRESGGKKNNSGRWTTV